VRKCAQRSIAACSVLLPVFALHNFVILQVRTLFLTSYLTMPLTLLLRSGLLGSLLRPSLFNEINYVFVLHILLEFSTRRSRVRIGTFP
jgi:hypothetical protein